MSLETSTGFHISVDNATGVLWKPISVPHYEIKQLARVSGRVLTHAGPSHKISPSNKFKNMPWLVIEFAKTSSNNLQENAKALLDGYTSHANFNLIWAGLQSLDEVKVEISVKMLRSDEKSSSRHSGIVFGMWNKPESADEQLKAVYKQIKQFCNTDIGCCMTTIAIRDITLLSG